MANLTHTAVKTAKPKESIYKLSDGGGLYLQVKPTGYKCWKYDFRINKVRGTYTIGQSPEISLKDARELHREAREYVAKGINPKEIKENFRVNTELNTKFFSHYADIWLDKQNLAESTYSDLKQRIDKNLTPFLDKKKINEFTTMDLFKILIKMSDRGAKETANRMAGVLRRIFNEVLILEVIDSNPAQGLSELLPKPDIRIKANFAHITSPDEFKHLLLQIDKSGENQSSVTTLALQFMPLVFLRPKNLRFLKWKYINFAEKMITIPASEMKLRKEFKVPLATQSVSILKELQRLNGDYEYVFVTSNGIKNNEVKPISESTTTAALKRLKDKDGNAFGTGYMTSHGFRHTASTLLNELGYSADAIELQLAHTSLDKIRATYNKAQLMDERIVMMQGWADYLDELKVSE